MSGTACPRIGILECGKPPETLLEAHGSYADMVARMLGQSVATEVFDVTAGSLPTDAAACEGFVLTGSPAGVYEELYWIAPLLQFLRAAKGRTKLVGICFGHQAMAQAFGGKVVKSRSGWGVGMHRYDVRARAPWMDEARWVCAPASHQDQVVEAPSGARIMLASSFTPLAGLDYGDAISFQCHPESTPAFGRALIEARRERFGSLAEPALVSYAQQGDGDRLGRWIRCFLGQCARPGDRS